jgi:hypothetical protein
MTRMPGRAGLATGLLALVATSPLWLPLPGPAFADGCSADDPSCVPTMGDDGGFPAGSVLPFVLVILVAIGITVYRVSSAREMARKSGMDTGDATRVALLDNDGLSATYLASELKGTRPAPSAAAPASSRTTAERLQELDRLRQQGLVTETEYAQHRAEILDDV